MAKIVRIELKAVKWAVGMEGDFFQANVYMDGKKIGFYSQDGNGGCGWFRGDAPGNEKELMNRIHEFYRKHPDIDTIRIYNSGMSSKEVCERRNAGTLPLMVFTSPKDDSLALDVFMEALCQLKETEKNWKTCVKKGFKAIAKVRYIHLPNTPLPFDEEYYTDGAEETLSLLQKEADEKSPNIVTQFASKEDFIIE